MNISLEVSYKSLNKHGEELCGDKWASKNDDSDIIILSDGMEAVLRPIYFSNAYRKILGTMLKQGSSKSQDCVDTIAKTLPVCTVRQVAYSDFFHTSD